MKNTPRTLALLPVVAAAAFCGAALYATGKALDFMFRDLDKDKIEKGAEGELFVDMDLEDDITDPEE